MNWIKPSFDEEAPPQKTSKISDVSDKETENSSAVDIKTSSDWFEKYKPSRVEDLAVNVKKIKDLKHWLEQSNVSNSKHKFLLIKGPPGSAKTTAFQVVCKNLGLVISEWITPVDRPSNDSSYFASYEMKSVAKSFYEFLLTSSRYKSCLVKTSLERKIVLIKDFPTTFFENPSIFHDILKKLPETCMCPIVFICNIGLQFVNLFPSSIVGDYRIHTINFNALPNKYMFKVMKMIISKEAKLDKNIKLLSDEKFAEISAESHGDLRSAISRLYFYNLHVKERRGFKADPLNSASPSDDNKKFERIALFQGLGRVLYPKRVEYDKSLKFVHSSESIVEAFLSEPAGFLSQLHENYPGKLSNVEDMREAAEKLSKSDLLMSRWQERDIFTHYSLAVAVQGLMVSNRAPQKARFEGFRKPQTSRMEVDSKAMELEGKAMFSELRVLDYGSLIDILPYARLLLPNLNEGQLQYVRKTSDFKKYPATFDLK